MIKRRLMLLAGLGVVVVVAGSLSAGAQSSGNYRGFSDTGGFLNIMPPGQQGVLNAAEALQAQGGSIPAHVADQLGMYGDLVYNSPGLTEERLLEFFKDASFGVAEDDIGRVYSPHPDVTVIRDLSFGVPHIFGKTRYATMYAQGYTGAEDRLFLMDVLRHLGRARLSEFLGASPANIALDRDQITVAPYKEADLTLQAEEIRTTGPLGEAIAEDLDAYVDGVNGYINAALANPSLLPAEYPALQQLPAPWKPEDTVAIASLVGGIFGKGGGGELRNQCGLQALTSELGSASEARKIFDDFHFANDPEAPTTSRIAKPYMNDLGPVNPAAHPTVDCSSLVPIEDEFPSVEELLDAIVNVLPLSNAVLVGGKHTKSGNPIAVFGPQVGYFIPGILVEKDVHGPGIDARGASFPGTDLWVQLGRGPNFAWSATSAGGDNIDQFVLELCEPGGGTPTINSMGYVYSGDCKPIESWNHVQVAKPSGGGIPESPEDLLMSWTVNRTEDYGPLTARGTLVDGTPVAVATLRSTYMSELESAPGFYKVNDPDYMKGGFDAFRKAMGADVKYTFNWFYIDSDNIGYIHSCKCPRRAPGVDPYLPAWGNGRWDWQGFISLSDQPSQLNPAEGWMTSWNNKQAPTFRANDANFNYGPVYRSQMLDRRVVSALAKGKLDRADVVDIMEDAGTVDLRGQELVGLLLRALGPVAPADLDPRVQQMRDLLEGWLGTETHRRDFNKDGAYDNPIPVAIMDLWWSHLVAAIFDSTSGNAIEHLRIAIFDNNLPEHVGSAFQGGVYGQVHKDIRQLLGDPVSGPMSRTYCGAGDVGTCRRDLWESLAAAAADLESKYGSGEVTSWVKDPAEDEIRFSAVGVTGVAPIHWVNRPTFQQVVQVGVEVLGLETPEANAGPLAATGWNPWVVSVGVLLMSAAVALLIKLRGKIEPDDLATGRS